MDTSHLFLKEKLRSKSFKNTKMLRNSNLAVFLSFSFLRRFFLFTEEKKAAKKKTRQL